MAGGGVAARVGPLVGQLGLPADHRQGQNVRAGHRPGLQASGVARPARFLAVPRPPRCEGHVRRLGTIAGGRTGTTVSILTRTSPIECVNGDTFSQVESISLICVKFDTLVTY